MKTTGFSALLLTLTLSVLSAAPLPPGPAQASGPADYKVLYSFLGKDGSAPNWLIQGRDGFFYGTTQEGGPHSELDNGAGVIFKLDSAGNLTVLHNFGVIDGYIPGGLMQAQDGSFYGTTMAGGQSTGAGAGTLFRMDANGTLTTLHAFDGTQTCCDGSTPDGPPIQGTDGNFYGVTFSGGAIRDQDHPGGFGTVYRYSPATSSLTIIHSFSGTDGNGVFPSGPLIQGTDGFLYGTTSVGGGAFRMDTAGNLTLLHAITDSNGILAGLLQAVDGAFYGTSNGPPGTIFRVDAATNYSVLNRFDGLDGSGLAQRLLQASDGAFYGPSSQGGLLDAQAGDLFRIDAAGALRVLHSFTQTDTKSGYLPSAPLVQGIDGALYGAATSGGDKSHGAIFRLDLTIPQPIASLALQPSTIPPGAQTTGTVTLSAPATAGAVTVALKSPAADLTVPATVVVNKGASSANFTAAVAGNAAPGDRRLYAAVNGQATRTLLTVGSGSSQTLTSLTLAPATVVGGKRVRGTVTLSAPAPAGGAVVALSGDSTSITVPASVTVPAGTTSATFAITTKRVRATTLATVTATYAGSSLSTGLTLTP